MMGVEQESVIGNTASEVFPEDAGTLVSVFHDVVMQGDLLQWGMDVFPKREGFLLIYLPVWWIASVLWLFVY